MLLICIAMVGEKVDASSLYEFQSKKCNCLDEFSGRASKSLTFIFIKALCLNIFPRVYVRKIRLRIYFPYSRLDRKSMAYSFGENWPGFLMFI